MVKHCIHLIAVLLCILAFTGAVVAYDLPNEESTQQCTLPCVEESETLDRTISKRPTPSNLILKKGDKWKYEDLPHVIGREQEIIVKFLDSSDAYAYKQDKDCYQDVHLFRARYL